MERNGVPTGPGGCICRVSPSEGKGYFSAVRINDIGPTQKKSELLHNPSQTGEVS